MRSQCALKEPGAWPVYPFMSHPHDSDARRKARIDFTHRKALLELQRVTLRYQVHNELAVLATGARREALELLVRASLVLALFALAACGGSSFSSAAVDVLEGDAGDVLQVDAAAVDAGEVLDQVDAGTGVLEHDAAAVDASSSSDAGDVDASSADAISSVYLDAGVDAGDVDARACLVITGYTCAVGGYPYPARCDSLPCCCATP